MTQKELSPKELVLLVVRSVLGMLLVLTLLLLSAGRWDYWQAWVYVVINSVVLILMGTVFTPDKSLMQERLNPKGKARGWDLFYFGVTTPLFLAGIIVAGLDARYGWSRDMPLAVYLAGTVVYLIGQGIFQWARYTNRFFSSVVRIQTDRGHVVIKEGPYRMVRHPGYVGGILYTATMGLVLGSWWACVPQLLAALMLVWRTAREDKTLQAELPGYAEYTRETHWRLIPGIW